MQMKTLNRLTLSLLFAASCVLPCFAIAAGLWNAPNNVNVAPNILAVDEAFQLQPVERTKRGLKLGWFVSSGYYLYQERIRIEAATPATLKLSKPKFPVGEKHHDEHLGDVHIYRGGRHEVEIAGGKSLNKLQQLKITYQGCAESGVCYPPQTRIVDIIALPTEHR
ncbi:MAG: protein-disulfide reductase DsbD domain-containing protein [Pseudomonadota bacterium]